MNELISIVILNRNKKDVLKNCLDSVLAQTYVKKEIIVVDNASDDGSIQMLEKYSTRLKVIMNTKNNMVAEAYNQGIEIATGSLVLCMNNDVFLEKDYLHNAVLAFGIESRIGAVSGKILNQKTKKIDSTGQFLGWSRRAKERGYGKHDRNQYLKGYIWGVSGACLLMRREMLNEIKLDNDYFDSKYLAYLEDLDLNWRANNYAWKSYYMPEAIAYHNRGTSGWEHSFKLGYLNLNLNFKIQFFKNRYSTILKNDRLINYIRFLPFIILYDLYLLICLLSFKQNSILKLIQDKTWIQESLKARKSYRGI